ncbi:branched-chain amino acid transaminase [Nonomuraea rubra]
MTGDFAHREGEIWLDGEFVRWQDATLHVLTHALHYASSVFEGIRVYGSKIFRLTEHTERLVASAAELGCVLPFTVPELDRAASELAARNGMVDGYLRPVAWRGSETMGIGAPGTAAHVAIAAWEWPEVFEPGAKLDGISLHVSRWRRPPPECAPVRAKGAGQYAIGTLARNEAEAAGAQDALLLDHRGHLTEATGANLFLVVGGELHTPVPDCFLDGITRRVVIGLARSYGIRVVERRIPVGELESASEVFLTGTAYEVQPVRSIGGLAHASASRPGEVARTLAFRPGEVTRTLADAYAKLVRS